ncbi:MAG: porin, partial [bacterium]
MRRAIKLTSTLIAVTAISGGAAVYAVAVSVPTDDFSVNLGLLLQAGHRYRFYEWENVSEDTSYFGIPEAELRFYGRVFERVDYDLRLAGFSGVREAYVGTDLPTGFSAKIGKYFVPFGVEATTEEGYITRTSRTLSSETIAPGREYGLRFDYVRRRENWPYE